MKSNKHKSVVLIVTFTTNNILYSISNLMGNVLFWTSLGIGKFPGAKKISLTNINSTIKFIVAQILQLNYQFVHIKLKGVSKYKKTVIKCLKQSNFSILSFCDISIISHNGCKKLNKKRI